MKQVFNGLLAGLMIAGLFLVTGCGDSTAPADTNVSTGTAGATTPISVCTKCGEFKGDAKCCKTGADKCGKCSMAKGAPGCCKVPAGSTGAMEICVKCGDFKGQPNCCKKDAAKCGKCGLNKGTPGCCKMPKTQ